MNFPVKAQRIGAVTVFVLSLWTTHVAWGYLGHANCATGCGLEAACPTGYIINKGALAKTNELVCLGYGVSAPIVTNTQFNTWSHSITCTNTTCETSISSTYGGYVATNWWVPAIPTVFTNSGTFVFTNMVQGLSTNSYCFSPTTNAVVGTYTVTAGINSACPPFKVYITKPRNNSTIP